MTSVIQHTRPDGSVKDGAVCKYCWKKEKRAKNVKAYYSGAFDARLKDPIKIICEECGVDVWTTKHWQVICKDPKCKAIRLARYKENRRNDKMKQLEAKLSEKVSRYLQIQYPNVVFRYDIADMKLTVPQAMRMKKLQGKDNRGYADLFIAEPNKTSSGLFIELKKDISEVYLKDGVSYRSKKIKKNGIVIYDHIQEQVNFLVKMQKKGYEARFGFGFDGTKKIIDDYMRDR